MTTVIADDASTDDEAHRLAECAAEPIRTPGAIQPHGALVGVDSDSLTVQIVSENAAPMLGLDAPLLGRVLGDVTGTAFADDVRRFVSHPESTANPLSLAMNAGSFDVIVHRVGDIVVLELEPVRPRALQQMTSALYALIQRLAQTVDVQDLRDETARGLRDLTGFDRVLIYRFHPDEHGEVVAEDRALDMEPYIGLHFPASDIPAQARELYLTKLSRAIVGTSDESIDLLAIDGSATAATFDLSHAELRSVSPHHLQFMRNMGQNSTLSFSMVREGRLIGMITCAHRTPLQVPFIVRRGIEVLASQLALQLSALDQVRQLQRQAETRHTRRLLLTQIEVADEIAGSLVRGEVTALDVIEADGVAVCIDGRTRTAGAAPPTAELEALVEHAGVGVDGGLFVTESLAIEHPTLAEMAPSATGVLIVPVGGAGDFLAFFRDEVLREIDWLGDQTPANRQTRLSPRNSFSAWTASVTRTATPWNEMVEEAVELGRDLESTLLRRAESQLAQLAMRDSLTGLPNRRGLLHEIESVFNRPESGEISLLFIDLDRFKQVNDDYGHDVGDSVIAAVSQRIDAHTRTTDVVARLGGDEFVVLCDGTAADTATEVARRVRAAIGEPLVLPLATLHISASVGTATTRRDGSPDGLLRAADEAMYRAKQNGDPEGIASAVEGQHRGG